MDEARLYAIEHGYGLHVSEREIKEMARELLALCECLRPTTAASSGSPAPSPTCTRSRIGSQE
jgi:hypothetical protein